MPLPGLVSQLALAAIAVAMLAACARDDEAAMRARLGQWFSLGGTVSFAARWDCAAGVFVLRSDSIGAAMPVTGSVAEMLATLTRQGRAALDDPAQAPDAALVDLANAERATGYALRRAALEARACMDADAGAAFHAGLTAPAAMLAFDRSSGTVIVIDRGAGRLVAAMGAK